MASALAAVISSLTFAASPLFADDEADHAALRSLVTEYEAAVHKGDPSLLKKHLASDFTGVMVTGEGVSDYESLNAYWSKIQGLLGKGGTYSVKINVAAPATIAGDIAYAHGTSEDKAVTSDGKEYQWEGFWTAICARDGDSWKIVRVHGSMDAISNTFVATALRAAATGGALFAGFVGFLIGAILFWIVGRRRGRLAAAA